MKFFRVSRNLPAGLCILPQVFVGLEDVQTLNRGIHDSSLLRRILGETEVTLAANGTRYMHVDDEDGSLVVALKCIRCRRTILVSRHNP